MSRNIKIVPTFFAIYDYDKEEDYMNAMSLKGWQLKKGGCFHHTYEQHDQTYRYKLDYNNKVNFNPDEYNRYMTLFEDQGWEHINSIFNGWHYFRKKYDPAAGEGAYQIYTDDNSLREMHNRWIRISRILQIIFIILMFCYLFVFHKTDNKLILMDFFIYFLGISLLELCIWQLKRKHLYSRPKTLIGRVLGYLMLTVLLLSPCFVLFCAIYQPYIYKESVQINVASPEYTDTLKIPKDGHYGVYFKSKSDTGEVIFTLKKDGTTVFRSGANETTEAWIMLDAGIYVIEAEYNPADEVSIDPEDKSETAKVFLGIKKSLYN